MAKGQSCSAHHLDSIQSPLQLVLHGQTNLHPMQPLIDVERQAFMQTQFQLGSYIHACTDETHSLANIQDLIPTLAGSAWLVCVAYNYCCQSRDQIM